MIKLFIIIIVEAPCKCLREGLQMHTALGHWVGLYTSGFEACIG